MAIRRVVVPVEVREKFNRVHGALLAVHKELIVMSGIGMSGSMGRSIRQGRRCSY